MIFESRAEPPERILASRRSRRMRACSEAVLGVEVDEGLGGGEGDGALGGVSIAVENQI